MKRPGAVVFSALLIAVLQGQTAQTEQPQTMTKIVVFLSGTGIRPKSFAALPRTIYRAGAHYARIEDPPDARQSVQKLIIIAEPDAYSVNLIDKRGTHAIDQGGGPNDLHLPMILTFDPRHELPELDRLEFGDEYHFFQSGGATKKLGPIINSKPTDEYILESSRGKAELIVKQGAQTPIKLSWQSPEGKYTYEYISYEELPFDSKLFAKPAGIAYREIPPDTTPDR